MAERQQPLVLLMIEVKKTATLIRDLAQEILNVFHDTNETLMDLDRRVRALEELALEEVKEDLMGPREC